jgi:hypothetical protein
MFTELDRMVMKSIISLIHPLLSTLTVGQAEAASEEAAYEMVLQDNYAGLKKLCENEMSRSDRYHHSFSVILFRIAPLKVLFEKDSQAAFHLVSEISRGIQTRTRKSDYGTWIAKDTFGMLTLEGSRRVRFLLSRVTLYITKDLSTSFPSPVKANELLVGYATYPGTAKQPDDLLREAEENLQPYS